MNGAGHQIAECGVHHPVLLDPRLPIELARHDDRLKMVLGPRQVRDIDMRLRECR
jgi:hypothetical protein